MAGIEATVNAGALTIALKGADGNDPSAGNPVPLTFRNVAAGSGTPSTVTVTAATSLVISSGSTMGFSSACAGRLWIVAFNDAGTVRLGAINCRSGTNIYPLGGPKIASSNAEGGAGGADSAHVFYTGAAVTSKAYQILGYMDWAAGLTTAGSWGSVPTTIKLFEHGDKLPGDVIQLVSTTTTTNCVVTSAAFADTLSEVALTPAASPNVVAVSASGVLGIVAASADKRCRARISRGGAQIGTGAFINTNAAGIFITPASMAVMDAPGTTSVCVYRVQINVADTSQTGLWGHPGDGAGGAFICAAELVA